MAGEAKIKLSVDTSQAQQQIKLIDQQLNGVGKGSSSIPTLGDDPHGTSDQTNGIKSTDIEKLIISQDRLFDSFRDYLSSSRQNSATMLGKLDRINESIKSGESGKSSTKSGKGSSPTVDGFTSILNKLATGATLVAAVRGMVSYTNQGSSSSNTSEMQAYNVFNTTDLYGSDYDKVRNIQSELGSPYGYNVYETLGVQSNLIGRTGFTSEDAMSSDTTSILKTARALSVDEGSLANTFGSLYQTGTYGHGEVSKFANLFATSIQEAGMKGREDEQLEVLESINVLLGRNLTTITENQYESALGLYSLFSTYSQSMSGSKSANLVASLNDAITGGNNTMDIALGRYSGRFGSMWEFEQQKEKGVTDPENLASILDYFERYVGLDLTSDTGKYALQKFLKTNGADLTTEEIEAIVNNRSKLKNGEYYDSFVGSAGEGEGSKLIEDQYSDYTGSKLEDMKTYEAESANAQERAGNLKNEATKGLKSIYNDLPSGLQSVISVGGSGLKVAGGLLGTLAISWLGNSLASKGVKGTAESVKGTAGKVFGSNIGNNVPKGATNGFTDYANKIVKAYESGGDVDGLLKPLSKTGEVTDDLYNWADELVEACGKGLDDKADDLIREGYKAYGKSFTKNAASGLDDAASAAAKAAGGLDDAAKAAGVLGKLGPAMKALGVVGTVIDVGTTAYDTYEAIEEEDYKKASEEVGGGLGGWGGAWAGAKAGGALGSLIGPWGTFGGTIIGGIAGYFGGESIGEALGGWLYDASTNSSGGAADISETMGEVGSSVDGLSKIMEENTKALEENTKETKDTTTKQPYVYSNPLSGTPGFQSHAVGADYIPYDGYLAELHKGETVLDAHTASEYRSGNLGNNSGSSVLEIRLSGSIDGMTSENQNRIVSAVVNQIKLQMNNTSLMNQLAFNNIRVAN